MTTHEQGNELDALKADIANLREAFAVLAADLKGSSTAGEARAERPDQADEGPNLWTDLLHGLGVSKVHGERVIKGLASEVERYPLVSIVAAFGIGFMVAAMWYRGSR